MNSFRRIDPRRIDVRLRRPSGYPEHLAREDTPSAIRDACGDAARDFPSALYIEPKDWADKARDNDKYNTWPINYIDRFTNQNPTHECTTHSLRANAEGARNRQIGVSYPGGPKKDYRYEESSKFGSVWLSPLSIYAEANPNIRGGANVRQVMEIACRRGMLPESIQPREYGFKHTLVGTTGKGGKNQASGKWVKLGNFPEGWKETAALFKPLEVIFPGSVEEAVCLLLHGSFVSVGRSGHAVPWSQLTFKGNDVETAPYADSYDVVRYDSFRTMKSAWRGAFAIRTMTAPDNWLAPAA